MKGPGEKKGGGGGEEESTAFKGFSISIISNNEIKVGLTVKWTEKKNINLYTINKPII
jgi:hypothetical protein